MDHPSHPGVYCTTPTRYLDPVSNTEEALAAAHAYAATTAERATALDRRNAAIRRMRHDDGLTYPVIAAHMGMTERNVHWIVAGNRNDKE